MDVSRFLLTALAAAAASLPAQGWTQISPATSPFPRRAGAMAFDAPGNRLILYGGNYASPGEILAETWSYNGNWTLLAPATPAPGRWGHQLVRDTLRNRLVTFGGRSPTVSGLANDTWIWNGATWLAVPTAQAPSRRYAYGLCYDSRRDRIVLFGGRTTFATAGDTWEFDGTDWTQPTLAAAPPPREDMVLAFDASRLLTVLFGGHQPHTATLLGDTWEYDGEQWQQVTPPSSPSPRYRCAAAFDSVRQRLVIYGGYDGTQITSQTFEYTGEQWNLIAVGAGSPYATEMYAAFDPVRNRLVTFGGVGTYFSNQTWEYQGPALAIFGSFGQGCPTSAGVATVAAITLPRLGQQFTMTFDGLPPATAIVLVGQGFSATIWNGNPLPFDLGAFGLTGCALEVAADAIAVATAATGSAAFGFAIPNDPSLINLAYYAQAFVPDPAAPNGLGGLSRAARALFGN